METNLSKIRRDKMLETITSIKKNIVDEETLTNLSMIENELTKKKYGLIWEEHEERVDKELETKIPTFIDIQEKEIISNPNEKFNFLLEGDNLHSLYLLEKTHKGKIDVIYIDPPYNTGNKDFTYNDKIIDTEDGYRHSKWLSFMERRLLKAKELLSEEGVIFISIDDNEYSQLKLLCDYIFNEDNFIANFIRKTGSTRAMAKHFDIRQDYVLIYSKNKLKLKLKQLKNYKTSNYENYDNDINGNWDTQDLTVRSGGYKYDIPSIDNSKQFSRSWRYSLKNLKNKMGFSENVDFREIYKHADYIKEKNWYVIGEFVFKGNNKIINHKKYAYKTSLLTNHTLYDSIGSNKAANSLLKSIIGDNNFFNNPKPLELLKYIVFIASNKDSIILDFFAGSGTTAQAVLELNKEDGGNRKFIICTNNENDICENITYKRIYNVIKGYSNVKGISANLKYYKTSYIPRINTEKENLYRNLLTNIKNLIQLENGVEVDNVKIKIYLNEVELDEFCNDNKALDECNNIYISSDILLTADQQIIIKNNNIDTYIIPEYYFRNEIYDMLLI
ncbi:MAG: site-specific DNA-methyltransferase [Bacilli bacterium]